VGVFGCSNKEKPTKEISNNHAQSLRMIDNWAPENMRSELPKKIKQIRVDQGYDPKIKPTHRWLRENGFSYFLKRVRELEDKPDRWLIEECGFVKQRKDWPCTRKQTIDRVEEWVQYEDEVGERINDTSVDSARSHLRKAMRIAEVWIGTSDILELGRGEPAVCARRTKQLMRGFRGEFDNSQTRYNYITTLRDFIAQMADDAVIDYDQLSSRVATCGWGGNNSSMVISPSTSMVKAYVDACETRTEQMIILALAVIGLRPSDICDPDAIAKLYLDAETPCVEFTSQRKNGPGMVPIVFGEEFIQDFVRLVSLSPGDHDALMPSSDSKSGSRSTEWLRNRVEEIGERTDATLPSGDKPTPKHFRQYWFTAFSSAYTTYLEHADIVATMQGSSSGRVSANHNFDERETWFNEFEKVAKFELSEPFTDFEPADEVGRIDVGEVTVDDLDKTFSVREAVGQVTLDGWKSLKAISIVGAIVYPTTIVSLSVGYSAISWSKLKQRGIELDPDLIPYSEMSLQRKTALVSAITVSLSIAIGTLYSNGTLGQLASGNISEGLPIIIGVLYMMWLANRTFPDPRDVLQNATE
jgi:hypothetical protein